MTIRDNVDDMIDGLRRPETRANLNHHYGQPLTELGRVARNAACDPDDGMSFEHEIQVYAPNGMWNAIAEAVASAVKASTP